MRVLEVMRQPLEDKVVTISRARGTLTFPVSFQLAAAMNPCPYGYFGDPVKPYTCSSSTLTRYQKRISGPLLDKIYIHIRLLRVNNNNLGEQRHSVSSNIILIGIEVAREHQRRRFGVDGQEWGIDDAGPALQENADRLPKIAWNAASLRASAQSQVSARTPSRVHKVTGTIIDQASCDKIESLNFAESQQFASFPIYKGVSLCQSTIFAPN